MTLLETTPSLSEGLQPTLELYYADTYGYFEVYKNKILAWAEQNGKQKLVEVILQDAKKSLEDIWIQDCKAWGREITPCPALENP